MVKGSTIRAAAHLSPVNASAKHRLPPPVNQKLIVMGLGMVLVAGTLGFDWADTLFQSADAHGVQEQLQSRFVRIESETFNRQSMQTGDILTIQGRLVSLVERDLRGWVSIFTEPTDGVDGWEMISRDPPAVFDIAGNSVVPYTVSARALEEGVYHVHTQLNVATVATGLGPGKTVVVQGEPIIRPAPPDSTAVPSGGASDDIPVVQIDQKAEVLALAKGYDLRQIANVSGLLPDLVATHEILARDMGVTSMSVTYTQYPSDLELPDTVVLAIQLLDSSDMAGYAVLGLEYVLSNATLDMVQGIAVSDEFAEATGLTGGLDVTEYTTDTLDAAGLGDEAFSYTIGGSAEGQEYHVQQIWFSRDRLVIFVATVGLGEEDTMAVAAEMDSRAAQMVQPDAPTTTTPTQGATPIVTAVEIVPYANLRYADLTGADLRNANLQYADLTGADLRNANLQYADLTGADLRNANLQYADLYADLTGADLRNANLRGADLSNTDLQGANLRYANLRNADLQGADLSGANLQGANLTGANLRNADLPNADLQFADLTGADIWFANLTEANLQYADLWFANLWNADLTGADLRNTNLQGADLTGADLRNTNLRGADLSNTHLQGADLTGADLRNTHLQGADLFTDIYVIDIPAAYLRNADLQNADLSTANLRGVDLSTANLRGADLTGAHLVIANLSNANLWNANLSDADLTGAHLRGANLKRVDLTGANLQGADLTGAHLVIANLSNANLSNANLSNANLQGADLSGANLQGADLSGANLRDAYLRWTDLSGANLANIWGMSDFTGSLVCDTISLPGATQVPCP